MSWENLQNYLALQDPSSGFSKTVTGDPNGTVLERLQHLIDNPVSNRLHVGALGWAGDAGTDFWIVAGETDLDTLLSANGWTFAPTAITEGSAADFLASADRDPTRIQLSAPNDTMRSPRIFGSYEHGQMAAFFLGATPTKLCLAMIARWPAANNAETDSGFGFTPGTSIVGNGVHIDSDGTNFRLVVTGGTSDVGAAIDNDWHLWKIQVDATTSEWFIDGVSQGTLTTPADSWPASFIARILNTTGANDIDVAWAHVWYE